MSKVIYKRNCRGHKKPPPPPPPRLNRVKFFNLGIVNHFYSEVVLTYEVYPETFTIFWVI